MVSHWLFISENYPFGFIFTQRQEKFSGEQKGGGDSRDPAEARDCLGRDEHEKMHEFSRFKICQKKNEIFCVLRSPGPTRLRRSAPGRPR